MGGYRVMVDDNFHYMDEEERYEFESYDTLEAAIDTCKALVDRSLRRLMAPGMTGAALYKRYRDFGEDPFIIVPAGTERSGFSAWTYAEQRAAEFCADNKDTGK